MMRRAVPGASDVQRGVATHLTTAVHAERDELMRHGVRQPGEVFWNLGVPALYEEALRRREGQLAPGGALVVRTGQHTGRSPNDKFIVQEPSSVEHIWWGKVNRPFDLPRRSGCPARPSVELEGSARVRCEGARAGHEIPRELRAVCRL